MRSHEQYQEPSTGWAAGLLILSVILWPWEKLTKPRKRLLVMTASVMWALSTVSAARPDDVTTVVTAMNAARTCIARHVLVEGAEVACYPQFRNEMVAAGIHDEVTIMESFTQLWNEAIMK
jgi:hypothetical protein